MKPQENETPGIQWVKDNYITSWEILTTTYTYSSFQYLIRKKRQTVVNKIKEITPNELNVRLGIPVNYS
jgi:hypothetical protein